MADFQFAQPANALMSGFQTGLAMQNARRQGGMGDIAFREASRSDMFNNYLAANPSVFSSGQVGPEAYQTNPMAAHKLQTSLDDRARTNRRGGLEDRMLEMQVEKMAREMTAEERKAESAGLKRGVAAGLAARTPEQWDALMDQFGQPEFKGQFENREALAQQFLSIADALDRFDEQQGGGSSATFGKSPVYFTDGEGNVVVGQLGDDGTVGFPNLPEGFNPAPGWDKVDVGTATALLDRGGRVIDSLDKNIAEAEGEKQAGAAGQDYANEAFASMAVLSQSIANMTEAVDAIDRGAETGAVMKYLPDVTEASASLTNAMNRMGLDVIGGVTFGALSKGELDLAMNVAAPRDLDPPALRKWLVRKIDAQNKAKIMLADFRDFMATPGATLDDWIKKNKAESSVNLGGLGQADAPMATAAPPPSAGGSVMPDMSQYSDAEIEEIMRTGKPPK